MPHLQTALTDIHQAIDNHWEEQLDFLKEIGRFPSTLGNEQPLQYYIADYLKNTLDMEVDRFTPDVKKLSSHPGFSIPEHPYDGREVVAAVSKKHGSSGKSLLFQSHIDVVPPGSLRFWSTNPWDPVQRGNKLYGRGMQDMKSGASAMIFAYRAIREAGYEPDAPFMLQTVIEEECTGNGALAALDRGWTSDAVLIPEPFGMKASTSQVGVVWFRITVLGAGAHTERASEAVNAIEKSYKVIEALKSYEKMINSRERPEAYKHHPHPLNINIGTIQSGDWPSSVPAEAVIEGRAGLFPGQDPSEIKEELKAWVLEHVKDDEWLASHPPDIYFFGFHAEGAAVEEDSLMMQTLGRAHDTIHEEALSFQPITATTDTRFYTLYYDTPATCYGPVGGNMHGGDEWVDLESVKQVTKVYAAFLADWCGLKKREGDGS